MSVKRSRGQPVERHDSIRTLAEGCQKTGWQVHAYCLMRHHYQRNDAAKLALAARLRREATLSVKPILTLFA